jgi:hypothetical protein
LEKDFGSNVRVLEVFFCGYFLSLRKKNSVEQTVKCGRVFLKAFGGKK